MAEISEMSDLDGQHDSAVNIEMSTVVARQHDSADNSEISVEDEQEDSADNRAVPGQHDGAESSELSVVAWQQNIQPSTMNGTTSAQYIPLGTMNGTTSAEETNPLERKTIFRVPAFVREAHKDLFEPKMVSIGPYHNYNKESLRSMEEHKQSFLKSFLKRREDIPPYHYFRAMREVAIEASKCYSEFYINIQNFQNFDEFVKMLILDGCFILEHLLRLRSNAIEERNRAYCNSGWVFSALKTDLALLENQIPFSVLHKLYETHNGGSIDCGTGSCPLQELFFKHSLCSDFNGGVPEVECKDIKHYLHLIYLCMTSPCQDQLEQGETSTVQQSASDNPGEVRVSVQADENTGTPGASECNVIPCASELYEAGVTFKCKQNSTYMFDITFENGIMEIPSLTIDCDKKIIFSNIVALEQTQVMLDYVPPALMSYLSLMDALVNTKRDVNLLVKKGILQNMMPDEENVAAFFNDLGEFFVPVKYKRQHKVYPVIQKYRAKRWPALRAQLKHDYFRNALSTFSVIVAGVLLLATILQTIFTGMQTF